MSTIKTECDPYIKKGIACRVPLGAETVLNNVTKPKEDVCNSTIGVNAFISNIFKKEKKVVCKRTIYTGDIKTCCTNKMSGNHACDPALTPNNIKCDNVLNDYCSKSDNMFTTECIKWYENGSNAAKEVFKKHCNTPEGIKSQRCKEWCIKNGGCDSSVYDYCRQPENAEDYICSCINSKLVRPECFDETCNRYGYKTDSMRTQTSCGTLVQCFQRFTIDGSKNIADQNEVILNCTQNPDAMPLLKENPDSPVSQVDDTNTNPATHGNTVEINNGSTKTVTSNTYKEVIQTGTPNNNEESEGLNDVEITIIVVVCTIVIFAILCAIILFTSYKNKNKALRGISDQPIYYIQ